MPVHHPHTIRAGTTRRSLLVYATHSHDDLPRTELRDHADGARAAHVRTDRDAVGFELLPSAVGVHVPGGCVAVDAELDPGVYRLGVPDAALAVGADHVLVVLRFPHVTLDSIEIPLVGCDPQDSGRFGLGAIAPQGPIDALRGESPLLTQRELDEAMARKEPS